MAQEAPAGTQADTGSQDHATAAQNLITRSGSPDAAVLRLMDEARKYRRRISTLKEQLEQAEASRPAEGSLTYTGDDATTLQSLGLTPSEIAEQLGQLRTLRQEQAEASRRETLTAAAKALKWDEARLASTLALLGDVSVEVQEVETDGEKATQYVVRTAADAEPVELRAAIEADPKAKPFLDTLPIAETPGAPAVQAWVEQQPGGKAPTPVADDAAIEAAKRRSGIYSF